MALAGNTEMLQLFRDHGVSIDQVDDGGKTILDYAVVNNEMQCFKWILHNYPYLVNVLEYKTYMRQILQTGGCEILKILHNEGIDLAEKDREGNTIIYHIIQYKCYFLSKRYAIEICSSTHNFFCKRNLTSRSNGISKHLIHNLINGNEKFCYLKIHQPHCILIHSAIL